MSNTVFRINSFRLILISFSCVCLLDYVKPQNLVPNSSFEVFIDFDSKKNNGWQKVQSTDSPDYFNFSKETAYNNIFSEYRGGTKPKTGNGFVGFFCFRVHPGRSIKNIREFIEAPLLSTLEKDSLYRVEISLCLDAESNTSIKNFGILLTPNELIYNKDFKLFSSRPQIEFNSSFLDSTHSWMTLQSIYKAKGNESFIVIGNFKSDKATINKKIQSSKEKNKRKKWNLDPGESSSYYYVDDVIIEKTSRMSSNEIVNIPEKEEISDTFNIDQIQLDSAIILRNIIFEFNKYNLLPQSYKEIDKVFKLMTANPNIRIKLEGHTDIIGSYEFNLQLSLKRVESVVKYLIEKGINPDRIEFAGYSFTCPIASNETEEGRLINRRVVFKIIEK